MTYSRVSSPILRLSDSPTQNMILILDNYDSFTYNLVHLIGRHTEALEVVRNDAITVDDVVAMHWNYICQPITDSERDQLDRLHRLHLDIVNADTRRLAGTIER